MWQKSVFASFEGARHLWSKVDLCSFEHLHVYVLKVIYGFYSTKEAVLFLLHSIAIKFLITCYFEGLM